MLLVLYDNNDHVHRVALDFDASSNKIVPLCNAIGNRIDTSRHHDMDLKYAFAGNSIGLSIFGSSIHHNSSIAV